MLFGRRKAQGELACRLLHFPALEAGALACAILLRLRPYFSLFPLSAPARSKQFFSVRVPSQNSSQSHRIQVCRLGASFC